MTEVVLGSTEIKVNKNGFGALPIQRISHEDAGELLKWHIMRELIFDTARFYTDSETKIGEALGDVRENIYIATKTAAQNSDDFWKDLNTSLNNLKRIILIFISSTIRHFVLSRETEQDFMRLCLKQRHREKSDI